MGFLLISDRIIYSLGMLAGGRLKLGPKRKDSGFHRIHKLHQQGHDSENVEVAKISLLDKHGGNAENGESSKEGAVLTLGSPRNHLHQINATNNIGLRGKLRSNIENIDAPDRLGAKETKQIQELKAKNHDLQIKIAALEHEQKRLQDIVSSQENQQSPLMAEDIPSRLLAELENQIASLRQENQGLRSREKRLENELQNVDRAYYEKEIDRLRNLCDNLQIQGMENKHSSSVLQQQKKEHEKQMSKKNQEIRNIQKQLEKQKMSLLEAKNQFNQKERGLRIAMQESQAANQVLCRSIQELTKQLQREETLRKEKTAAVDNLQQQIDILVTRGRESESKCVKLRKTFQQQLSEQTRKMLAIEEQQREKNRESESMIYRLSSDIERLKIQQNQQLAASKVVGELRHEGQQLSKELRIVRLEQELKQLQLNLGNKDQIIQQLENKLKQYFSPDQYKGLQRRCKQLQEKRLSSARYYEEKLYNYQKENDQLRLAKIEQVAVESQPSSGFDQIVKKTLGESEALRKEVKRMGEALAVSKEEAAEIRQRQKNYLNELEIMRKKVECSSKNFSIELEVEKQKLINEIDSLKRKLTTAETRLQYKINENKQKDEFIKSVIVGRSSSLERQSVMAQLQRIFLQRDRRQVSSL